MMTQPNLDYLFQVTAPRIEPQPSGSESGGLDRPGFRNLLFQASLSARDRSIDTEYRKRPAPSGPLEDSSRAVDSGPFDDGSAESDLSTAEYGACAEAAHPDVCGSEESRSDDVAPGAVNAGPVVASDDVTPTDESAAQDEAESAPTGDEAASFTDAASAVNAAETTHAATNSIQVALTETANDAVSSDSVNSEKGASGSQSAPRNGQGNQLSPRDNNPGVAGEFPTTLRKADLTSQSAQLAQVNTLAVNADTQIGSTSSGENSAVQTASKDTEKASRTSAKRDLADSDDAAGRNRAVANSAATIHTRSSDAGHNTRRAADKIRSSGDARSRLNEKSDTSGAPRSEAAANVNQAVASAVASDVRVDTVAALAKNTGDDAAPKAGNQSGAKSDVLLHPLARANRGTGGAGRLGRSESAHSLPRIDTARFVGRVAKAIQTATDRGGALQLRLSPPELGSLRLQLVVHDGVMTASLEAESPAARQLLLDHLPALRDRLAEQNIRIERFDVDVRQEGSGGQPDARASQQEQPKQQFQQSTLRRDTAPATNGEGTAHETPAQTSRITNNGLNVLA